MNLLHRVACRSTLWERYSVTSLVPWGLEGVDLGAASLEIGPGYGANIRALLARTQALTGIEICADLASRLKHLYARDIDVVTADATSMPLEEHRFDSVVSFSMLHHVPTPEAQDRVFAEAFRVLRGGGVFAGTDGLDSPLFRAMHSATRTCHCRHAILNDDSRASDSLPSRWNGVG